MGERRHQYYSTVVIFEGLKLDEFTQHLKPLGNCRRTIHPRRGGTLIEVNSPEKIIETQTRIIAHLGIERPTTRDIKFRLPRCDASDRMVDLSIVCH